MTCVHRRNRACHEPSPLTRTQDNDAVKTYKKVSVPKSDAVSAMLRSAISANPLFKECSDADLGDFVDVFSQKKFAPGSTVIKQGDVGETFYVVESGALDIHINVGSGADMTETQVGLPYGAWCRARRLREDSS